jgi:hypothetical protein
VFAYNPPKFKKEVSVQKYEYLLVETISDEHLGCIFFINGERFTHKTAKTTENKRAARLYELLNEMGEQGWELIAHPTFSNNSESDLLFKRVKQSSNG